MTKEPTLLSWRRPLPDKADCLSCIDLHPVAKAGDKNTPTFQVRLTADRLWIHTDLCIPLWAIEEAEYLQEHMCLLITFFHIKTGIPEQIALLEVSGGSLETFHRQLTKAKKSPEVEEARGMMNKWRFDFLAHRGGDHPTGWTDRPEMTALEFSNEMIAAFEEKPPQPFVDEKPALAHLQDLLRKKPVLAEAFDLNPDDVVHLFQKQKKAAGLTGRAKLIIFLWTPLCLLIIPIAMVVMAISLYWNSSEEPGLAISIAVGVVTLVAGWIPMFWVHNHLLQPIWRFFFKDLFEFDQRQY